MHEKAQPSLPSLHIATNPNMNSTKRIHARMIIEPNVKDIISLPKAQQQMRSNHQQFRRIPLKVNPKVVQAFSPYQSYSIIVIYQIILRVLVIFFMKNINKKNNFKSQRKRNNWKNQRKFNTKRKLNTSNRKMKIMKIQQTQQWIRQRWNQDNNSNLILQQIDVFIF
ncbi:unnamed protein product [Paramecium primaurelia]|uniref:Transmembrane protein n=1 Tax=Paramecium primaurelia TaxID=5886 RepID=A0A8S1NL70_PARPR|nr:unnamed protein product [Paramecium primaurelia]